MCNPTEKQLDELRKKARAHDVYMKAIERARDRGLDYVPAPNEDPGTFLRGYQKALRDLNEFILDEDAKADSLPAAD